MLLVMCHYLSVSLFLYGLCATLVLQSCITCKTELEFECSVNSVLYYKYLPCAQEHASASASEESKAKERESDRLAKKVYKELADSRQVGQTFSLGHGTCIQTL